MWSNLQFIIFRDNPDARRMEGLAERVKDVLATWKKDTAPIKSSQDSYLCRKSQLSSSSSAIIPKCRPNNWKDFQHRMGTFATIHWFAKPVELDSLVCARYGWINTGPDELICECCEQCLPCVIDARLSLEVIFNLLFIFLS